MFPGLNKVVPRKSLIILQPLMHQPITLQTDEHLHCHKNHRGLENVIFISCRDDTKLLMQHQPLPSITFT